MKKLIVLMIFVLLFSTLGFTSETIDVKDYIKGKFPMMFNIYLSPLGELDEYEKEFIDLLQNLPEEEQKNFAKEVYNNGFSREILEKIKGESTIESGVEIETKNIEEPLIPDTGKWIWFKSIDPINDTVKIAFQLKSDSGESIYGESIYLVLVYENNKTRVYIDWNSYLGLNTDYQLVTFRFGNQKSFRGLQSISNDSQAIFINKGIKCIGMLIEVDSFVAQVTPYNENSITAIFDVRGLKEVIKPYNDVLHWIKD